MTSGVKIKYGYEESSIYQEVLRLINEQGELAQISDNTQKAKTHSDNSDAAIASMKKSLESFKVKLVQAANDVHSATSYAALASDLEALMFSIRDTANTSINGSFLFSGTNMKQKPFGDDGTYYGNDQLVKAQAGDGVEIAYNVDGLTLAQGVDSDYAKRLTTNMQLYNQTQLHHAVMSKDDPTGLDEPVPITASDTIRDLVGQPDDSKSTYFYLRGSKPDGESFKARIEMTNGATVQDLMDQIGRAMGNTNIYQAVEVSLNFLGNIEIKDAKSGRMLTDLHMVASDTKADDISELGEVENAHIYAFNKSGYAYARTQDKIASAQDQFDQRLFKFDSTLRRQDNEAIALKTDTIQSVMGENVDRIGFDINGVSHSFAVNSSTKVSDLLSEIKTALEADLGGSFDVDIQNGAIAVFDNAASPPDTAPELFVPSKLSAITITAENTGGEKVLAFSASDALAYDRARFEKSGATLTSSVSQIVRADSSYATAATELKAVSGSGDLDEKRLHLEINDINGERKLVEITLRDTPDANGRLSTYQIIEPSAGAIYDLYDSNGALTTASGYQSRTLTPYSDGMETRDQTHKGVTYQQLMNVINIAVSGETPADGSFEAYNAALKNAQQSASVSMDELGRFTIKDKTTSESKIQVSLFDADTDRFDDYDLISDKSALQTYKGVKGEQGWTLSDTRLNKPLSDVFGFEFSGALVLNGTDMNGAAASVTLSQTDTLSDLMTAIDATFGDGAGNGGFVVDIEDGRLFFRDNAALGQTQANINFSFQDAQTDMKASDSPALTFASNNALTIDESRVNLFDQLSEAIEAVRLGMTRPDGNSENGARNIGIQNAIAVVDHLLDHLNRIHTDVGSTGSALQLTYEKSEALTLNVKTLKSETLDMDIGAAVAKMNQMSVSYQALLSTLSRINGMSLVNYLS
jgi:flagellar hook-associated protein 3 FlgL